MFASLSLLALLAAGCEDECKKGRSECVSGALIRTCVPTADSNEWLVTQCAENSVCSDDAEELEKARGAASGDAGGGVVKPAAIDGAACVGTCLQGERSCESDALARVCVADGVWELDPCELGEKCIDGACQVSSGPGTVQRCVPGTKACASDTMEKVCDPDGTAWTTSACLPSEHCVDTECVPDPASSCDDANSCLDNKTAIRCLGQGEGFELVPCEGDTYCEFGVCRGAICALGSVCNGTTTSGLPRIRECTDGVNFKDTVCGVNEACQQDKDHAKCVPLECVPGTTVCGDPRDPAVDPTKTFTTCAVNGAGSGVPEWVTGTCDGATSCDPTALFAASPCTQACTPKAERCASGPGIAFGKQVCLDDGTWGPVTSCNTGTDSELQCVIAPSAEASTLPKALCVDPICAHALSGPGDGATGFCEGGKLRECTPDGKIAAAKDCAEGVCVNTGSGQRADGRFPGACQTTPQCKDGDTQCATFSGNGTMFQTCENGFWSTKLTACADDGICWNVLDKDGNPSHQCGGECAAGTRRCDLTDPEKIQTCDSKGKFGTAEACDIGTCTNLFGGFGSDATCRLQCVPNALDCEGTTVAAADGSHLGTTQQRKCGSDGTYAAATSCAAGEACRVGASGEVLGCVQCIGEDVAGGNEDGVIDVRCSGAKLQSCGADNKWATARDCEGGTTCQPPAGLSCGNCSSASFIFGTCNAARINDNEDCGSCAVAGVGNVTNCTESAIAASGGTGTLTCVGQGYTAPGSFGGFADCCGGAHRMGTYTCDDVQPGSVPANIGGVADCCSHSATNAGGGYAQCL